VYSANAITSERTEVPPGDDSLDDIEIPDLLAGFDSDGRLIIPDEHPVTNEAAQAAPMEGTRRDPRLDDIRVPDKVSKSDKELCYYFGVSVKAFQQMTRDAEVQSIVWTATKIITKNNYSWPREETIASVLVATEATKFLTVTKSRVEAVYKNSTLVMAWAVHQLVGVLFTGAEPFLASVGIHPHLFATRAWLFFRAVRRKMQTAAEKTTKKIREDRAKGKSRVTHYATEQGKRETFPKSKSKKSKVTDFDRESRAEDEARQAAYEEALNTMCRAASPASSRAAEVGASEGDVTEEDADMLSPEDIEALSSAPVEKATKVIVNPDTGERVVVTDDGDLPDGGAPSDDDGYATDHADPNESIPDRVRLSTKSRRVVVETVPPTRDRRNKRWRWFADGKVIGGDYIQEWFRDYEAVDWIDDGNANPSFDPSALNNGISRAHKRDTTARNAYVNAHTAPGDSDGEPSSTSEQVQTDTASAGETSSGANAPGPSPETTPAPAPAVEGPTPPAGGATDPDPHPPRPADDVFMSRVDEDELKKIAARMQEIKLEYQRSKDPALRAELEILADQARAIKKAGVERGRRRQHIWATLHTDARTVRDNVRQQYRKQSNMVSQIAQARYVEAAETVPDKPDQADGDDAVHNASGTTRSNNAAATDDERDPEFRPIDAHDESFQHNLDVLKKICANSDFQPTDYQGSLSYLRVQKRSHPQIPGMRTGRFSLPWQTLLAAHMAKLKAKRMDFLVERKKVEARNARRGANRKTRVELEQDESDLELRISMTRNAIIDTEKESSEIFAQRSQEKHAELEKLESEFQGVRTKLGELAESEKELKTHSKADRKFSEKMIHPGSMLFDEVGIGKTDSALSTWLHVS
jgi:hypothetical protein